MNQLNRSDLSQKYTNTANTIKSSIMNTHFNGTFIYEANGRDIDSSVLHAIETFGDDLFAANSAEVAKTIQKYAETFCYEYNINQTDNKNNEPGILVGRYPGDSYAGGNPWQLLTAALAETFYRAADMFYNEFESGQVKLENANHKEWLALLNMDGNGLTVRNLADSSVKAGDAVMYRLWKYIHSDNWRVDEQIDRNNGNQKSAKGLTWSWANVLHAIKTRRDLSKRYYAYKAESM